MEIKNCKICIKNENEYCDIHLRYSHQLHGCDVYICCDDSCNQPERSKREDLDCCKRVEDLDDLLDDFHIEFCDGEDPYKSMNHYNKSCELLMKLIQESKMRCSEHCSNAVREAK